MMNFELQQRILHFFKNNLFLQLLVSHEIVCATETVITNFSFKTWKGVTKTIPALFLLSEGLPGKLELLRTTLISILVFVGLFFVSYITWRVYFCICSLIGSMT